MLGDGVVYSLHNLFLRETKRWMLEADTHGDKLPQLCNNQKLLNLKEMNTVLSIDYSLLRKLEYWKTFNSENFHQYNLQVERKKNTFPNLREGDTLCKIRRSPPQTFTTPDVHHPLFWNATFTTDQYSPPPTIITPTRKFTNCPSIQNVPAVQTTLVNVAF